jgi:hypothetical protein
MPSAVPPQFTERFSALTAPTGRMSPPERSSAVTGSPAPVYSGLSGSQFLRRSTRATFSALVLWGLSANGLSFSGRAASAYSSRGGILLSKIIPGRAAAVNGKQELFLEETNRNNSIWGLKN